MSTTSISRIQHRRGTATDLNSTTLAQAELGWTTDEQKLYIGNGTIDELGSPTDGNTEILTEKHIGIEGGVASHLSVEEIQITVTDEDYTNISELKIPEGKSAFIKYRLMNDNISDGMQAGLLVGVNRDNDRNRCALDDAFKNDHSPAADSQVNTGPNVRFGITTNGQIQAIREGSGTKTYTMTYTSEII